jgi:transcription initiation factor TFIIIB Brf1 subunit/transcription initiation factor TFIIB
LHEAVAAYYRLLTEIPETSDRCCESPHLHWRGTLENAAIVCASCGFVLADDGQPIDWNEPEQIAWEDEVAKSSNGAAEDSN